MKEFDYKKITLGDIENNNHLTFECDGDRKKVIVKREEDDLSINL